MVKARLQDRMTRRWPSGCWLTRVDTLLRLLHPMIPFLTEEVWQLLGEAAPERGIDRWKKVGPSIMIARWPSSDSGGGMCTSRTSSRDSRSVAAVREIRSRQNVPPREQIDFVVRCDESIVELLSR